MLSSSEPLVLACSSSTDPWVVDLGVELCHGTVLTATAVSRLHYLVVKRLTVQGILEVGIPDSLPASSDP